ncbi:hypothetical protein Tco_1304910 [Tanacetum coccineum]
MADLVHRGSFPLCLQQAICTMGDTGSNDTLDTSQMVKPYRKCILIGDPEQAQKDNDMSENLALIAKNDNQTGQFGNQRAVNVVGARETVGGPVVQQSGIQCLTEEFVHYARGMTEVQNGFIDFHVSQGTRCCFVENNVEKGESNSIRDSCLVALQNKQTEFERYKAFNDRTVDYDKLERRLNETLGLLAQKEIDIKEGLKVKAYEISIVKEKHDELVKPSLLTKSHYEGLVRRKQRYVINGQKQQRIDLNADGLYNEKQENLRVWLLKFLISKKPVPECSELGIHDHNNELSRSNLVPKVVPLADKTMLSTEILRFELEPCQGDSLNLPDHRINKDGDGDCLISSEVGFITTCSCSHYKHFYKHQDSRIMKYQVYQGRLLASFQDDAKYEHVGQDTRSQGGKDDQDKQGKDLKISDIKSKSERHMTKVKIQRSLKHEGTSLQRIQRPDTMILRQKQSN